MCLIPESQVRDSSSEDHLGRAIWGAECSQAGLVCASLRWRESVFSLLRPYTAITGNGWLAMVRRRSTVRFRKGALQVKWMFRIYQLSSLFLSWNPAARRSDRSHCSR